MGLKHSRIRKSLLIAVFLFMFIVPLWNLLEIYFIRGTFISMDIGSLSIADPVMIFQAVLSGMSATGVLFISILIPVLMVVFFGRVWCSHACPYTLLLEGLETIPFIKKRMYANKKGINNTRTKAWRYSVFAGFFVLVGIAGVPLLHLFSPPAILSTQALLLIKTFTFTVEILFIISLLVMEVFFIYRFACRYICPTGSCLSLFQNSMGLHVQYCGKCINCGVCARICPMALDPVKEIGRLCNNCGRCVEHCPDNTKPLKWTFGQ